MFVISAGTMFFIISRFILDLLHPSQTHKLFADFTTGLFCTLLFISGIIAFAIKIKNELNAELNNDFVKKTVILKTVKLHWKEIKSIELSSGIVIKSVNNKMVLSIYSYSNPTEIVEILLKKAKEFNIELKK